MNLLDNDFKIAPRPSSQVEDTGLTAAQVKGRDIGRYIGSRPWLFTPFTKAREGLFSSDPLPSLGIGAAGGGVLGLLGASGSVGGD